MKKYVFLLLCVAFVFSVCRSVDAASPEKRSIPMVVDYQLPKEIRLCGEKVPLSDRDIWERMDREFTISVWDRAQVFMWMKRKERYFPYIEKELKKAGLPDDLKYLAVAESALISYIRSRAGAVGLWQFMPGTGIRYGLRKNSMVDERRNFELSTEAAIKYLTFLHEKFGSWTLAMAAYNCGEQRVESYLKEQNVSGYYQLRLPKETERYVFRIASAKIILENPLKYGYVLPKGNGYKPWKHDVISMNIKKSYHITDVAGALGISYREFKELNPQFIGFYMPTGCFRVSVPENSVKSMAGLMKKLKGAKVKKPVVNKGAGRSYLVKRGDTLAGISKKTGVPVARLKRINKIRGSKILVGQRLKLRM